MIRRTPVVEARLPELSGTGRVLFKLECLQRTGSFKLRGAVRVLESTTRSQRASGVVTASAGNHGAGLALAGRALGIATTVVLPRSVPSNKRSRIAALGAEIIIDGDDYDAAQATAISLADERGARFVSPFDDDLVIAGNGASLAAEIADQVPDVTRVVVPVGGGGLMAGVALFFADSAVSVTGVQPEQNCAMHESLARGRALTRYDGRPTCAEGCAGAVAERTFDLVRRHGAGVVLVSERAIEGAVAALYRQQGVVAECSGAVSVAGLIAGAIPADPTAVTVAVVSGGNIDDDELDRILTG